MTPLDDDSLHSLLARGRLSGAQRERALEAALQQARGGRGWARRVVGSGLALAAAAAVAVWIVGGTSPGEGSQAPTLVAKGSDAPLLTASCMGRPAGECHSGDRLIFEIEGARARGFFAAYAECASGERIWYFPTATGSLPEIVPNSARTIIGQAARIGSEHGVGRCELTLFALGQPSSREELLAPGSRHVRRALVLEVKP